MKNSTLFTILLAMCVPVCGCSAKTTSSVEKMVFRNGHGKEITISSNGATISGGFYPAASCSTTILKCVEYGDSFAIIAPLVCTDKYPYDWRVHDLRSVFIAPTPHNPYRVLMSTTYGGLVAFVYDREEGVTQLYYDQSIQLGKKAVWQGLDSFDYGTVQYERIGNGHFFACRKEERNRQTGSE